MLKDIDQDTPGHFFNTKKDSYQDEKSGEINYSFNSSGYLGEEYNPSAEKKIFVAGCSLAMNYGIQYELSWPYLFKKRLGEHVNILNFSVGGASNDYISRSVLRQCSSVKPDILLVMFTYPDRKEFISENGRKNIGPWNEEDEDILNYYAHYTDELGNMNLLRNILLVQYFCKTQDIDYIFVVQNIDKFKSFCLRSEIFSELFSLIDMANLCDFSMEFKDKIYDGLHPGPESHDLFAKRLFDFYSNRQNRNE